MPGMTTARALRHRKNENRGKEAPMKIRERAATAVARGFVRASDPRTAATYIVYGAAVFASLGTLDELAATYAGWNPRFAPFFAIIIDIYWLMAFHAALDKSLNARKRAGATFHGIIAIGLSIWGNILYHELHAGIWHLGHASGSLLVGVMASVPLLVAAALTHLIYLSRAEKPKARADRPKTRTVPANRPGQPPQVLDQVTADAPPATTPGDPAPSQDEEPTTPAPETAEEAALVLPRELKAGGRPDPIAVEKAREIYRAAMREDTLLTRRSLMDAVNAHFGFKVIGETSASAVIDSFRHSKRTA